MATDDFEKVTVRLAKGTRDRLQRLFPGTAYNQAIRLGLDAIMTQLERREAPVPFQLKDQPHE